MKPTTRCTGLAMALAVVLGWGISAMRAEDAKVSGDLKKLQGTWVRAGDEGPELNWTITGETLKAKVNDAEYTCTIVLDSKAKPHATIDLKITEGPGDTAGKTSKGIYKFEDEQFVICVTHPGVENRPTEFKPTEDESFVFKLKKEK